MKIILICILNIILLNAGEVTFSSNWKSLEVEDGYSSNKRIIFSLIQKCKIVQHYTNGNNKETVVVVRIHKNKDYPHITVRLYRGNKHKKTCHVYVQKKNDIFEFSECSCVSMIEV